MGYIKYIKSRNSYTVIVEVHGKKIHFGSKWEYFLHWRNEAQTTWSGGMVVEWIEHRSVKMKWLPSTCCTFHHQFFRIAWTDKGARGHSWHHDGPIQHNPTILGEIFWCSGEKEEETVGHCPAPEERTASSLTSGNCLHKLYAENCKSFFHYKCSLALVKYSN